MHFRLLGCFEVGAGERVLDIGSPKQRTILAMLVLHLNRVVPLDTLVEELWGDEAPASAIPTVQSLVSRLRRSLSAAGEGADKISLRAREPGYVLEAAPGTVDAHRFECLVARGREALGRGDAEPAVADLTEALGLWRGAALAGLADRSFARLEAARLDEARLSATEELVEAELALGRPGDALSRLEAHVAANPLRERAWGQLMLALYRLGRQAEALRAYQHVRRLLVEELGVEPTPWLRDLEDQILHQRSELEGPLPTRTGPGEAAANGGAAVPPSPPHRASRRSNLPLALNPFVGRASELDELVGLFGSVRLVTLTGVGGAGKTRLALEAAGMAAESFPDGVWVAELGPLRDPSGLVSEVMAAVGLEGAMPGTRPTSDDYLCDHLRARRLLLVLDNCEHLVEAVARLVHAVLAQCPEVTVVATSREVLGLPGEVVWGVPPLSLPPPDPAGPEDLAGSDAVALFCERASRAGFGLSATNFGAVAQICRRLDGIPLALELAAARIRVLGAPQLAARLDDRFRLLTGGARTAVPRHQTLRAAMDWSYQLLPPPEQVALRRLSVFPDTFDLEAAEAVVGDPAGESRPAQPGFEVLDLLARLVDKSMVTVQREGGDVRYSLLETVRQYAAERLAEAGETAATHRRHRDFFLGVARQRGGSYWWTVGTWGNRLVADYPSFRIALERSLEEGDQAAGLQLAAVLWTYCLWAGRREGAEWLERALAGSASLAIAARAEALVGLGALLMVSGAGDASRCWAMQQEAAELAARLGDGHVLSRARFFLGEIATLQGDPATARELCEAVLEFCEANDAPIGAGWAHHSLGWAAVAAGEGAQARAHFEQGLKICEGHGDVATPHLLGALATVTALAGDGDRARSLAEEAVAAARPFSLRGILLMALTRATEAAILSGAGAETWLWELLALLRELGARRWAADALEMAAVVRHGHGEQEAAARLLGASEALRTAFGESPGIRVLAERVQACRDQVADALGPDGFAEEDARGQKMSLDEALSYALLGEARLEGT